MGVSSSKNLDLSKPSVFKIKPRFYHIDGGVHVNANNVSLDATKKHVFAKDFFNYVFSAAFEKEYNLKAKLIKHLIKDDLLIYHVKYSIANPNRRNKKPVSLKRVTYLVSEGWFEYTSAGDPIKANFVKGNKKPYMLVHRNDVTLVQ